MQSQNMGVSENSVPLNPMVLLIIIPIKWLFHWEYTHIFRQTHIEGLGPKSGHSPKAWEQISTMGQLTDIHTLLGGDWNHGILYNFMIFHMLGITIPTDELHHFSGG